MTNNPGNFPPEAYEQPVGMILAVISVVVFLTGLRFAYFRLKNPKHPLKNLMVTPWALFPPSYFLCYYYVLFRSDLGYWNNPDAVVHYN